MDIEVYSFNNHLLVLQCVYDNDNTKQYMVSSAQEVEMEKDYFEAQTFCDRQAGGLITVSSEEINKFLVDTCELRWVMFGLLSAPSLPRFVSKGSTMGMIDRVKRQISS